VSATPSWMADGVHRNACWHGERIYVDRSAPVQYSRARFFSHRLYSGDDVAPHAYFFLPSSLAAHANARLPSIDAHSSVAYPVLSKLARHMPIAEPPAHTGLRWLACGIPIAASLPLLFLERSTQTSWAWAPARGLSTSIHKHIRTRHNARSGDCASHRHHVVPPVAYSSLSQTPYSADANATPLHRAVR
jgi:hypothetical protein